MRLDLIEALMGANDYSREEAEFVAREMRERLEEANDYEEVEEMLYDYGLEPDYLEELI